MSFGDLNAREYWNAANNLPKLISGKGVHGFGYVVSQPGSTNLDGYTSWAVGDIAIFLLDKWYRIATNLPTNLAPLDSPHFTGAPTFTGTTPPRITTATVDQNGVVNVDMAGADASGASDAHVAFQTCLDLIATKWANGAKALTLLIPGQRYKITSGLSLSRAQDFTIEAKGATIRQETVNLFNLPGAGSPVATPTFRIRGGLNLEAGITDCVGFILRNIVGGEIEGVGCTATTDGSHLTLFDIANCTQMNFRGGLSRNMKLPAVGSIADCHGVYARLGLVCLNLTFNQVQAQSFANFIYGSSSTVPGIEGIFTNNCLVNPCLTGVFMSNTGYLAPGGLRWTGGHIEAYNHCLDLTTCAQIAVSNALLYRNSQYSSPGEFVVLSGCQQATINDNEFCVVGSGTTHPTAMFFSSGTLNRANDNQFTLGADVTTAFTGTGSNTDFLDNMMLGSGLTPPGYSMTGTGGATTGSRIVT